MSKAEDKELQRELARIIEVLPKLLHEMERLRGDVVGLYERIEPLEDEKIPKRLAIPKKLKTLRDALDLIVDAREGIRDAEYDLNYIRSRIDQLMNEGWSRDEMKKWIKE
jgi:hypothetical protein